MAATEQRLMDLINHYKPRTLILNGDVMDGGGSIRETMKNVDRVRDCVAELILIEGNHDRAALKRDLGFVPWHITDGFALPSRSQDGQGTARTQPCVARRCTSAATSTRPCC